jgi:Domain of unknown function (DUF6456)
MAKRKTRAQKRIAERTKRNAQRREKASESREVVLERARTQPVLDRYLAREQIETYQHQAGSRLYENWVGMGQSQAKAATFEGSVHSVGFDYTPWQLRCYERYVSAIAAVGFYLAPVLIAVCLHDETAGEWASRYRRTERDGMAILRLALDALAYHWGIDPVNHQHVDKPTRSDVNLAATLAEVSANAA